MQMRKMMVWLRGDGGGRGSGGYDDENHVLLVAIDDDDGGGSGSGGIVGYGYGGDSCDYRDGDGGDDATPLAVVVVVEL
ncbi:hypothetical protein ElyMa_002465400 [Elysia marginata]|uniref:Uncharacterized protein n=1 Tax=Elysia marginata TaxID=1093978 RepID=A0AAV4GLD0_9GAST|nr:hypothetical protein ElyMa_002465400 [Elysia marginata]